MVEINYERLEKINGGAINGTLINAFARGVNSLLELGRSLGSAIRRAMDGKICPV